MSSKSYQKGAKSIHNSLTLCRPFLLSCCLLSFICSIIPSLLLSFPASRTHRTCKESSTTLGNERSERASDAGGALTCFALLGCVLTYFVLLVGAWLYSVLLCFVGLCFELFFLLRSSRSIAKTGFCLFLINKTHKFIL